jgi:hypothetical protein
MKRQALFIIGGTITALLLAGIVWELTLLYTIPINLQLPTK